jgi:hypothetical protein
MVDDGDERRSGGRCMVSLVDGWRERDGHGQSPSTLLANIVNKDHVDGLISFDFYSKE